MPDKRRIAILGGGMGGLTTAYFLSSQPGWEDNFEITIYQMGWRLGGKCASSRGPNQRIEEHGIHGFMGSYYNALPLVAKVFDELKRPPGPLSTFEQAMVPVNFAMQWEWHDKALRAWPQRFKPNTLSPRDPAPINDFGTQVSRLVEWLHDHIEEHRAQLPPEHAAHGAAAAALVQHLGEWAAKEIEGAGHVLLEILATVWRPARDALLGLIDACAPLRRMFIGLDFVLALLKGLVDDDIPHLGYDSIDDLNWSDWLLSHGAHPLTLMSPVAMTTVNITYNNPAGDTSQHSQMAAGAYARWTLRGLSYMGSFLWRFGAGTGESIIAPMYELLLRRGVRFEFFHKVTNLGLTADKRAIEAVEIDVQARLKEPATPYSPLIEVKQVPSWPPRPLYDQLHPEDARALAAADTDLESWWNGWRSPERRTLRAGLDFDTVVLAIPVGAMPHICPEILQARPAWRDMVARLPTVMTQAMQIWLSKDLDACGWSPKLKPDEMAVSATYLYPQNGNTEYVDLIPFEDWPADNTPKSLWYFCGLMADDGDQPAFSDTDYPRRMSDRVKYQSIQYLQTSVGNMLPNATPNADHPPGDPVGLDFELLVDTRAPAAMGIRRFDAQFWRANIDPTERYVTTPPGSVDYRLDAWDSTFDNMVLAGDWIYTGLNIGSFEGTVMSGKLASYTLTAQPPLNTIYGYPTRPKNASESWRPPGAYPHPPPPYEPPVV
jgi:uncharacterized protein with NAD-binding domain and iron-sulfur cluster